MFGKIRPGAFWFWAFLFGEVLYCRFGLLTPYWWVRISCFSPGFFLVGRMFPGVHPFLPGCPACWRVVAHTVSRASLLLWYRCDASSLVSDFIYSRVRPLFLSLAKGSSASASQKPSCGFHRSSGPRPRVAACRHPSPRPPCHAARCSTRTLGPVSGGPALTYSPPAAVLRLWCAPWAPAGPSRGL